MILVLRAPRGWARAALALTFGAIGLVACGSEQAGDHAGTDSGTGGSDARLGSDGDVSPDEAGEGNDAGRLADLVGPTGTTIVVRLSAFLLFCIGIQVFWNGAGELLAHLPVGAPGS